MKQMILIGILASGIFAPSHLCYGQSSPSWITSINYEQNRSGASTTMDIHVGLLQPGAPGFPCADKSTLTVDALPLTNADVKSAQDSAHVNPLDLNPAPESGGFVYHIPVGVNLSLPTGWQSFTLSVPVRCTGSAQGQQSPAIIVRRIATNDPLQVFIAGGEPQWNRSGKNEDSLSFVIKSNSPVSIQNLLIRDASNNNSVTQPYNDPVEATSHSIALKTLVQLQGSPQQYKYDVQFTAGGLVVTPAQPLPAINLPAQPTKDFVLLQFPTPDQLTVHDTGKDFTFDAKTNDSGTVDVVFDVALIGGSNSVKGTNSADGITHTFTISKNNIPPDGQYSFHYVGTRSAAPSSLANAHPSVLIVATKTLLTGPIALGLSPDSKSIVVSYCLSQTSANEVRISNNPSTFSVVGPGNKSDGTGGCAAGTFFYTATIPLTDFSNKVNKASAPSVAVQPAAPASPTPPQLPIQLRIVDTSSAALTLATLNLAAVLLTNQDPNEIISAVTTIADKNTPQAAKTAATQTLKQKYGLDQSTIDTLTQIGKKTNGAGSTIGTILGTLGKSFLTAYLGIPAAPAPAAK
jgi:hypothetical protein